MGSYLLAQQYVRLRKDGANPTYGALLTLNNLSPNLMTNSEHRNDKTFVPFVDNQ